MVRARVAEIDAFIVLGISISILISMSDVILILIVIN